MRSIARILADQTNPTVVNRPVRITFVITDLDVGGAERALVALATGLDRRRWHPSVICLDDEGKLADTLRQSGIETTCLSVNRRRPIQAISQLARALKRTQPEIVQSFLFHANFATRLAALGAGRPWVIGGLRVAERQKKWHLRLDWLTQSLSAGEVCVSEGVRRFSLTEGRLSPDRLVVIPNGIATSLADKTNPLHERTTGTFDQTNPISDLVSGPSDKTNPLSEQPADTFDKTNPLNERPGKLSDKTNPIAGCLSNAPDQTNPSNDGQTETFDQTNPIADPVLGSPDKTNPISKSDLGLKASDRVALFVGRLDRQKAVNILIEAAAQVMQAIPNWHLMLVGEGPERSQLERQANQFAPLAGRIHWMNHRPDVPRLLDLADFLILPSLWEGMPNVVLEAMAAGRAVVGTRVEGTEDLVVPGETGWLVPPGDPVALGEAIRQALEDPDRLSRFGQAARARVEQYFTPGRVIEAYEAVWRAVLGITFAVPQHPESPLDRAGLPGSKSETAGSDQGSDPAADHENMKFS